MDTLETLIGSFNKSYSAKAIVRKLNAQTMALGIVTSAEYVPTEAKSFRLFMLSFINRIQASKVAAELSRFHASISGYNTVVFRVYD